MCEWCNMSRKTKLMSKDIVDDNILGDPKTITISQCGYAKLSVVFEIRNGAGYIRIGDVDDMQCLDHGDKVQVYFCPQCGRKLSV